MNPFHGFMHILPPNHMQVRALDSRPAANGHLRLINWAVTEGANEDNVMSDKLTVAQQAFGEIAPDFADLTDRVLFGEVWDRPGLSPRDRSLITVASLVALHRTNELPNHLKRAIANGVSRDELVEVMMHLAFYSGWPTASSALRIARGVFDELRS